MFDDKDLFALEPASRPLWQTLALSAGGVGVVAGGALLAGYMLKGSGPAPRPHNEPHITQVMLPPPPPPPPPPKVPPPTPQKMVQDKPKETLSPQKAAVPKPMKVPSPPAAVTTSITGPGPGTLAAGNGGGGDCVGSGCGTGDGGGGDEGAYYDGLLKTQIEAAIHGDDRLRFEEFRVRISFQLDGSGRVTRAVIADFKGDSDVKAEVNRVLHLISTNDSPSAAVMSRTFTTTIVEQAHG